MSFIKKLLKLSALGGALTAAYGLGRMNPPRKAGRFETILRKGKK